MPSTTSSGRLRLGERLKLACSCVGEVVVSTIIMLPRHHVVRILSRGEKCRGLDHARRRRVVVRVSSIRGRRVFKDIRAA